MRGGAWSLSRGAWGGEIGNEDIIGRCGEREKERRREGVCESVRVSEGCKG